MKERTNERTNTYAHRSQLKNGNEKSRYYRAAFITFGAKRQQTFGNWKEICFLLKLRYINAKNDIADGRLMTQKSPPDADFITQISMSD